MLSALHNAPRTTKRKRKIYINYKEKQRENIKQFFLDENCDSYYHEFKNNNIEFTIATVKIDNHIRHIK